MVPELPEDQDAADADAMEEDAADADARRKAVQKAREEAELRKRSQVERWHRHPPALVSAHSLCCSFCSGSSTTFWQHSGVHEPQSGLMSG